MAPDVLNEFFQMWKNAAHVSQLNRIQCLNFINYFNGVGKLMHAFDEPANCRLFSRKFNLGVIPLMRPYSRVREKIVELEARLKEITPILNLELPGICASLPQETVDEFTRYKDLCTSQDYQPFIDLFTGIYKIYPKNLIWAFICTPSGTGKTQLAFSLPMKRLFFLMEPERAKSQPIYRRFEAISVKLNDLITQDITRLQNVSNNCYVELSELFQDFYITQSTLSAAATFILLMLKKLVTEPHSEWLSLEVEMDLSNDQSFILTIDQLAIEIELLFPIPEERPVIFFDECIGTTDIWHIAFMRNILVRIGLIPIFMGSNPSACIDEGINSGKKFKTNDHVLQAFIINQLPPMNLTRLSALYLELNTLISAFISDEELKSKKQEFINLIFEILKKERPLIINLVFQYLKFNFCLTEDECIDIQDLFSDVQSFVFSGHESDLKQKTSEIIRAQIGLLMSDKWFWGEKREFSALSINRFIGYLNRPESLFDEVTGIPTSEFYFPLYSLKEQGLGYKAKVVRGKIFTSIFHPISIRLSFDKEPLASFAFSGALDHSGTFNNHEASPQPISSMKALSIYVENASDSSFGLEFHRKKLHFLPALAAILASRSSKGIFFNFIENFASQLTLHSTPWKINTDQLPLEWKLHMQNLVIPLLAPIASTWNEEMKYLLKMHSQEKSESLSGGVCKLFGRELLDGFLIVDGVGDEKIAIEFFCHSRQPSDSNLIQMLHSLHENSGDCQVGFAVAMDFSLALNSCNWKYLPGNCCVCSLVPAQGSTPEFEFKKLFPLEGQIEEPMTDEKPFLFILISLLEINMLSGNMKEFIKQIPMFAQVN